MGSTVRDSLHALQEHASELTAFEQSEVLDVQCIYFWGPLANKLEGDYGSAAKPRRTYCLAVRSGLQLMRDAGNPATVESNCGFDDARGYYTAITGDHLGYRYEVLGTLGRGSFGQVLRCQDHATGTVVAVKVIRNKKRFHTQALVELGILEHLRDKVCRLCSSARVFCKCLVRSKCIFILAVP